MATISTNLKKGVDVKSEDLVKVAEFVLQHQQYLETCELTIVVTDNKALRQLNFKFMGIDEPTDVLSFSANETNPETGNVYLGDIIISYEYAKEQANSSGHSITAEIQLLLVHGLLHLMGYDHENAEKKKSMWEIQRDILYSANIPIARIPE